MAGALTGVARDARSGAKAAAIRALRMAGRFLILAVVLCSGAGPTAAHETTRSYATVARDGRALDLTLRVAFRDIEVVAWMDENLDGRITWGEARARLDAVDAYVRAGLALDAGGPCSLERKDAGARESGGIAFLDLDYTGICPDVSAPLTLRTRLFTEIDPDHRMFVQAAAGGGTTSTMLSAADPEIEIGGDTAGPFHTFARYFRAGAEHLTGGPDHLLFLLVLMLPAITMRNGAGKAALGVLTAVTGFTLAHALTLTAAITESLRPPGALIEALIALSIVLTALDNVRPFIPAPRAAVAAFFGLIHGFGFATALGALQLTGSGLAVALVGFNLGIEAAQVGIVLVVMPALYMLGGGRGILWIGSGAAGMAGLWWFWTRTVPFLLG